MKQLIALALFAASTLTTAGTAIAQGQRVQATIPFDFNVGSKLLPPGTYQISYARPNLITVQNWQKSVSISTLGMPTDPQQSQASRLVFNRYGDQYFLRNVFSPQTGLSVVLTASKREKKVRQQDAGIRDAQEAFVALK